MKVRFSSADASALGSGAALPPTRGALPSTEESTGYIVSMTKPHDGGGFIQILAVTPACTVPKPLEGFGRTFLRVKCGRSHLGAVRTTHRRVPVTSPMSGFYQVGTLPMVHFICPV